MKSTGIVRRIDKLGRIVIPYELRRTLTIQDRAPIEIYVDGDQIVLKAHHQACVFCDNSENLRDYMDKCVCQSCLDKLNAL